MDEILVYLGHLQNDLNAMNEEFQKVGSSNVFDTYYEQATNDIKLIRDLVEDAMDEDE